MKKIASWQSVLTCTMALFLFSVSAVSAHASTNSPDVFDIDSDGDGMPDAWEIANQGKQIHDGIGDAVPADQENVDGTITYGGLTWQPWRVQWGLISGELASIPASRVGFNYGHWGNGRGATLATHIGDTNWTDYDVELDVAPRGISSQFNPYSLPNDLLSIYFYFRVEEAYESWNTEGWTYYGFNIGETGTVGLSRAHRRYCPGTGYHPQLGNSYRLVNAGTESLYDYGVNPTHVKIRVFGSQIMVWVDGTLCIDHKDTLVSGSDNPLPHGGVIISSLWEQMAAVSNLIVRKIGMMPDVADADEDYDNDGFSNLEEYKAGSNPLDASSVPSGGVTPDGLVMWNKLGSQSEVENSEIGPDGTITGGGFTNGVFGAAYLAEYNQNGLVTFPATVVPVDRGCIEIWAKMVGFPSSVGVGELPNIFRTSGLPRFSIHFNANDGCGNGGLCARAGSGSCGTGFNGSWTYSHALGGSDVSAWHHYALVWSKDGIEDVGYTYAVYLDGDLNSSRWSSELGNVDTPSVDSVLALVAHHSMSQGSMAVDNLKVWDYAKTNFNDRFDEGTISDGSALILHYTFDDDAGTNVLDESGNENDGYLVGAVGYEPSISGQAIKISSRNTYVVSESSDLNMNGWTQFTASAWVSLRNYNNYNTIMGRGQVTEGDEWGGFYLRMGGIISGTHSPGYVKVKKIWLKI